MSWRKLKKLLLKQAGFIYIPDAVKNHEEPIVMHLSDTPRAIYPNLKRLIEQVQPEYIVHTGDLVDNLKIELYPNKTVQYLKQVHLILELVNSASVASFVALGNHDVVDVCEGFPDINRVQDGDIVKMGNLKIMLSHQYKNLKSDACDYRMFGHQPEANLKANELNGIDGIHILFLNSKKVYRLDYPIGTDEIRTGTYRIGI